MDDLTRLLRESFEYSMTNVHTAFPAVVVKYDASTRRADVQPSIKRKLPSGEYMDFPVIPDAPVLFPGTKKYTIHFPLEKDDEVLCVIMERGTDKWRDSGASAVEESDPRRFCLMDCIVIPGLQPVEFIEGEGDGFSVVHKESTDGDVVASVVMDGDTFAVKHKDAALTIKGDKLSFKNGSKDFFTVLSTILDDVASAVSNTYGMKTFGSPASHTVTPDDIAKMQKNEQDLMQDKSDLGEVMEAG